MKMLKKKFLRKSKNKNELIGKTEGLSEKKVADEKKFLIKIISRVKSRQKEIQEKGKKVEENIKHESKMINGKESMRIELKK